MSQFNVVKNDTNPDQVYFDVTVSNFQSTTTNPPQFYFNEQRTSPFVQVPEDYYLSILRFTVDTGTLPVFIPTIQTNQSDPNLTIYSVTLEYLEPITSTLCTSQSFIEFIPQDTSITVPPPPSQTTTKVQVNETGYYNIYSYSYFCYLIQVAFLQAFSGTPYGNANLSLLAQVTALGGTLPTTFSPFINFDTSSLSGVIYADVGAYALNLAGSRIFIYMNAPLFQLFNSFPARYLGYVGVTSGRNFLLELANVGSTNLQLITPDPVSVPASYNAVVVYQEYSTISNWSPMTAIVFCSNTLPITPNQVSTPLLFNDAKPFLLGGNNNATANIITDLATDGSYRPFIIYTPNSQYRYITLYGNRPLYNLDLSIFYRVKTGELIPLTLPSGGSVTIKLAFIRKNSLGTSK
jgi:hypothetical protein